MKLLRFLNVVAVVATLIINALSQILPFNNQTSAQIANSFQNNYFLPANYVFSVWSIIYIGMIAFAIYQARSERPAATSLGWWFIVSCICNCLWLFCFHWELFPLSMVFMIGLLISLIVMYRRLRAPGLVLSNQDRWFIVAPISVYIGWITVATIANATYVLLDANWNGFGIPNETWGAIMIIVGGMIGGAFANINRDPIYAAVIVWAFVGILTRHPEVPAVAGSAAALSILVAVVGVIAIVSSVLTGNRPPMRPNVA